MKKFLLLLMFALFCIPWAANAQSELTVYDGTATNSNVPFYGLYADYGTRSQFIIPATDLAEMGGATITKLNFYTSTASVDYDEEVTVYLKEVDNTTFETAELEDWTTMTPVYVGGVNVSNNQWEIEFTSGYVYGGGNLMIGVQITGFGSSCPSIFWYGVSQSSGVYTAVYNIASSSHEWSSTVNRQTFIPKTTLTYIPAGGLVCEKPTGVTLDYTPGATTAMVTWNESANANSYNVEVNGFIPYIVENGNFAVISPLQPATVYTVRVQADCGEDSKSGWVSAGSFITPCDPVTSYPWNENFESYEAGDFSDLCWVNEHISGSGSYLFKVNTSTVGSNSTHKLQLPDQSAGTLTMLRLPLMNLPANYEFMLDVYRSSSTYNASLIPSEGIRVFVSTNGEIEGATELGFIPRQYTVSSDLIPAENEVGWYTYEIPIGVSGNCYIILRGESQYSTATYMDNFFVKEVPACAKPASLTKSDVTAHTVTLSWTAANEQDDTWQICLNNDENDLIEVSENPFILPGLTPETAYSAKVRTVCGGPYSDWSNTVSFTTAVACPAPTAVTVTPSGRSADVTWTSDAQTFVVAYKGANDEGFIEEIGDVTSTSYTLTGLTPETAYIVSVKAVCGGEDGASQWSDKSFSTTVTCPAPTFTVDNVTTTSAQLNMTSNIQAWDYQINTENAFDDVEIQYVSIDNIVTLDELTPATTYFVRLRGYCEGEAAPSAWTSVQRFSTQCNPITAYIWNENFESYAAGEFSDPCWVNEHISGSGSQLFKVYTSTNGSNSTHQLQLPDQSSGTLTMLKLPLMNLPENYEFVIDVYRNSSYSSYTTEGIRVFASADGNIEGATELAFIPRVYSVESGVIPAEAETGWYTYELPIPMSGNCNIILRGESQWGAATYMDNFFVKEIPACATPTALAVTAAGNAVTASWEGTANIYNIDVNGEVTEGVTSPYTMQDLDLATIYTVKVQAVCEGDVVSDWTEEKSVTTDLCASQNQCEITIELTDAFGDGWNGNKLEVVDVATQTILGSYTLPSSTSEGTFTLNVCDNRTITFNYVIGSGSTYPYENGYIITDINEEVIAEHVGCSSSSGCDAPEAGVIATYDVSCVPTTCRKPTNVEVTEVGLHSANVSWTENGEATEWVIAYMPAQSAANPVPELVEVTDVTTNPFLIEGLTPETEYIVIVRPVCEDQMIKWSDEVPFTTPVACPAPTDVTADGITATEAIISWVGSASSYELRYAESIGEWLHYDNGVYADGIGTGGGNIYWAVKFPAGSYSFDQLTKVAMYDAGNMTGIITVYNDGDNAPSDEAASVDVTLTGAGDFVEFEFGMPVVIDPTKPLWIVVHNTGYESFPAFACDDQGDANGRWFSMDGEEWEDVADYDLHYTWMLRAYVGEEGEPVWTSVTGINDPTYGLSGLTPETKYEVQVRAICDDEDAESDWTQSVYFTTEAGEPADCPAPVNLAVDEETVTADEAVVVWAAGDATQWNIRYRKVGTEAWTPDVVDLEPSPIPNEIAFYPFENLDASTTYEVQVQTVCGNDVSDWVTTTFTTKATCNIPTNLTVVDAPTSNSATIDWEDSNENPLGWRIAYKTQIADIANVFVVYPNEKPYTLQNLSSGTVYEVRVRAICDDNNESSFTEPITFTTESETPPTSDCDPVTDLAVSNVTGYTADVDWTVEDNTSYTLRFRTFNTIFSEGFEDGMDSWTVVDADGDGANWFLYNGVSGDIYSAHSGDYLATSASYNGGALTPDNWLISEPIALLGDNTELEFYMCGQDALYAEEHWGVYIIKDADYNSDEPNVAAFTKIYEEDMDNAGGGNIPKVLGAWGRKVVNLSAFRDPEDNTINTTFANQTVRIAFRHFNVTDMFRLNVDDITVSIPTQWMEIPNAVPGTLGSLDPETKYEVQVQADCGQAGVSEWSTSEIFTTTEACPVPTNLAVVGEPTTTEATIDWEDVNETPDGWWIYYKPVDDAEWVSFTVVTKPYTFFNLTPATTYEVKVKTTCNEEEESEFTDVITFRTKADCNPIVVDSEHPFIENFDATTAFPPTECWDNIASGSYQWSRNTSYYMTGSASVCSGFYGDVYLVTPELAIANGETDLLLTFWSYNRYVSDGGTNSVVLIDGDNETVLWTQSEFAQAWVEVSVDLSAFKNQNIRLAFKYEGDDGHAWYVDSVKVAFAPVCPAPTGLAVNNVTAHTADIVWNVGNANQWNLRYKETADDDDSWTVVNDIDENGYSLDNTNSTLIDNTEYEVQVQADCGNDEISDWSSSATFTTLEGCPEPNGLNTSVEGLDITLTWTEEIEGMSYDVVYATTSNISPNELVGESVNGNSYTLSGMELGDYYFWVRTDCSNINEGNSHWAGPVSAHVGYCVPATTSRDGKGITAVNFGIGEFVVNNVDEVNGLPASAPYYGDYTEMVGAMPAGVESTVAITTATGSYPYGFVIWVDLNNNMVWEDEEIVYTGQCSTGNGTLNASFTIPADQTLGDYRMRIGGADGYFDSYIGGNASAVHSPCYTGTWAVFHDYTLRVTEAPACLVPNNLAVNYQGGTEATVIWQGNGESYNIEVNGVVTEGVTSPHTLSNLEYGTSYEVAVMSVCGQDGTSEYTPAVTFTTDLCAADDMCEITFVLHDSYGDRWSGSVINVVDVQTNTIIASVAATTYNVATPPTTDNFSLAVCDGRELQFVWESHTDWDSEASYEVYDVNGNEIFSGSGAMTEPVDYTVDCTPAPTCAPVEELTANANGNTVTLTWEPRGNENDWMVKYRLSGTDDWETDYNDGPEIEISNLASGTYDVCVFAICGEYENSDLILSDGTCTNFNIGEQPVVCPAPTNLTATNITPNSAYLSWDANGATRWLVHMNEGAGGGSFIWETNYYNVPLDPSTTYTFYVEGYCDGGVKSEPSNTITFTTPSEPGPTCEDIYENPLVVINCGPYIWYDEPYEVGGTYTKAFPIEGGCYRYETLVLTIDEPTVEIYDTAVCSNTDLPIMFHGYEFFEAGELVIDIPKQFGCVDTLKLTVSFKPTSEFSDAMSICESDANFPIMFDGQEIPSAGTHTFTLENSLGCDSVVTLTVNVLETAYGVDVQTACGSFTWIDNQTYYQSTTEPTTTIEGGAANGCDSVVTLNLTIINPDHQSFVAEECESYTWTIDTWSHTYNESGVYTHAHNVNGCQQVDTLHLTINKPFNQAYHVEECESYTWTIGDWSHTYSESNTYYHSHQDAHGCLQVDTLYLTITTPDHQSFVAEECESYTWTIGTWSHTYNESGVYTHAHNVNGCQQVDTLHLTINKPFNQAYHVEECESYTWTIGDWSHTYSESNTYYHSHQDAHGCLQVDTLYLTIKEPQHEAYTIEECGSYTWINGTTYNQSTETTYGHTGTNGCWQVDTLHLTIHNSATTVVFDTICEGIAYYRNGFQIPASEVVLGDYEYSHSNYKTVYGCDSTIDLKLHVEVCDETCGQPYTDEVNGDTYGTMAVNRLCWMTSNFRGERYADGTTIPFAIPYSNLSYPAFTADPEIFGLLYNWSSASKAASDDAAQVQGVCPAGWRLPSRADLDDLSSVYTEQQLRSTDYWVQDPGTNESGFDKKPAGFYNGITGKCERFGATAFFFTSDYSPSGNIIIQRSDYGCDEVRYEERRNVEDAHSVRCVRELGQ